MPQQQQKLHEILNTERGIQHDTLIQSATIKQFRIAVFDKVAGEKF
jgi:hypothetical protein